MNAQLSTSQGDQRSPLAPYTAILLQSYGGPTGPDTVLPFMRNATRGRNIPDERLLEVAKHYDLFDGVSPINEANDRLVKALSAELESRLGAAIPIVIGNRNWHPFVTDTVADLIDAGHQRVLSVATSAYGSYSGCRQYYEDLSRAQAELTERGVTRFPQIDRLAPYGHREGFIHANAKALVNAIRDLWDDNSPLPLVLFTTHSIPTAMNAVSGGSRGSYVDQHLEICRRVAAEAEADLDEQITWELVYCSRSGAPHIPWLEPDINDRIAELATDGVKAIVSAPIGFLADHMEVKYDLDTEAAQTAADHLIRYRRAATAGVDPEFVTSLADAIIEHAQATAAGQTPPDRGTCGQAGCCQLRPAS